MCLGFLITLISDLDFSLILATRCSFKCFNFCIDFWNIYSLRDRQETDALTEGGTTTVVDRELFQTLTVSHSESVRR